MTDEQWKMMAFMAKMVVAAMFAGSVVLAWSGEVQWVCVLLPAFAAVSAFCNRPASAVYSSLFGIGIVLHGYGQETLSQVFLVLGCAVVVAHFILNTMRARTALRMHRTQGKLKGVGQEGTSKAECSMTSEERRKVTVFCLAEAICVLFLISGMACLIHEEFVWTGILFAVVGAVNTFLLGLPIFNVFILEGLMLVSLGYEKRELATIFGVIGFAVITANTILLHRSIASGGLERLRMLARSRRFAFVDYLKENEITCILLDKCKRRLNATSKSQG